LTTCGYIHINPLQAEYIILGKPEEDIIFNYTILITKFTIYSCKLGGKKPNIAAVKAYLKYTMEIEKYIAIATIKQIGQFISQTVILFC
jgi:hypothetical protein